MYGLYSLCAFSGYKRIEPVSLMIKKGGLRWFGHIEHKGWHEKFLMHTLGTDGEVKSAKPG